MEGRGRVPCRHSRINLSSTSCFTMPSLENELARRFTLRTHKFEHAGFRAELIAPAAPDELIDVSDFNIDERLPYWAELWPSARALAMELLEGPLPESPVLELGCGLALPSLALRWRGVEVLATDYYPEALEFAIANAIRNEIPPPRTVHLDWRSPPEELGQFDLVIAADVLYERRNAEILADLLPRLVTESGRAMIADPGRAAVPLFRKLVEAQGWHVREIASRRVAGVTEGREVEIRILSAGPAPADEEPRMLAG